LAQALAVESAFFLYGFFELLEQPVFAVAVWDVKEFSVEFRQLAGAELSSAFFDCIAL
jgi:hypothetical protein